VNILGNPFIALGVLMCVTLILFVPRLACLALAALLKIAGKRSKREWGRSRGEGVDGGPSMKIKDAPSHVCPERAGQPPLAYRNSVGRGRVGHGEASSGSPGIHFYTCPLTGVQYMATSGGTGPLRTPPIQYPVRPQRRWAACGSPTQLEMIMTPEKVLMWHCEHCGATPAFEPEHSAD